MAKADRTSLTSQPADRFCGLLDDQRAASGNGMDSAASQTAMPALHRAVAMAARNGASYQWIAGVLAGCLAADAMATDARAAAIATLSRPSVKSAR